MLILLALTMAAAAESPDYPVSLMGGMGGVAAAARPPDGSEQSSGLTAGAFASGRAVFHVKNAPVGVDLGGRTALLANDLREATQISAGLRWEPGVPYLRGSLVHQHETPWDLLKEKPLASIAGVAEGIRHRSGFELAVGAFAPLVPDEMDGRMGAFAELSAVALPDNSGPWLYSQIDLGLTVSLGKNRTGV